MTFPDLARPRLAVGVISAGKVGSVLGAALARAGHDVVAVTAVSEASRRRAATALPDVAVLDPTAVAERCSLLLLAVPDDELPGLVSGLAVSGALNPGQLIAHTSGRHGLAVLEPAVRRGALPLALHPAMTFAGDFGSDLARVGGAPFGVTAPEPLRAVAEVLAVEMGGEPTWVPDEARPLYHAALAHGANHLITLVCQAVDALAAAGIDHPDRVLAPLLSAALDNALRRGDAATTGPVVRGDADTVGAHLDVLSHASPEAVPAYLALARATADRALGSGRLSTDAATRLLGVLGTRPRTTS
ncbi:MAG TPA: DUF2520 domain-containing protein [Mycobacteriales bacterium]|nr:DUF2520 domain-containing protein [Mycobacteriales bacterium]